MRTLLRISICMLMTSALAFVLVMPAGTALGDDIFSLGVDNAPTEEEQLVDLSVVFSVSTAAPGNTYQAAVIVGVEHGWHINSATPYQDYLIAAELSFGAVEGLTAQNVVYPKGMDVTLADEIMSVYHDSTIVSFEVTVEDGLTAGEYVLPVSLTSQPCNDVSCVAPRSVEADLHVTVGEEGTPVSTVIFGSLEEPQQTVITDEASTSTAPESELGRLIEKYGFWGYFLALGLAFVTGLLLSFSPCTYPMIPITVSIFAGQQRSIGRGFIMSLFYVGSMALVYGLMGLVVSLVGGVFGAWLASPAVVIGIAIVFVIFALSMFGLYELQVPSALRQKLGTTKAGGGLMGAVVLGIVAALVVSPCVGPFVAGILLYVATHGSPYVGFLTLFVFALGLGTLFVIIGTFSSAINALPNSGEWMESVKKFFGFVLLLMASYFLRTIVAPEVTALLTALVLLSFGVFAGGLDRLTSESGFFSRLKKFLGIIALLIGGYLFVGTILTQGLVLPPVSQWVSSSGGPAGSHETELIPWETDLEAGLARAKAEGKPVLIDTWATWCINCRVLEKKTFGNPDVAQEAKRFVPIKVQLETADSPITLDFKQRFGLRQYSLPTTLLLDSEGSVQRMLQGVVGPDDMIAEMRKL